MKTELQQAIQDLESQLAELKAKAEEIEQEEWWEAPDFFEGECVPVELNKYLEFQRNLWCLAKCRIVGLRPVLAIRIIA